MAVLKPGTRLRSAVCTTTAMVVKAPKEDVDLRCGGAPMIPIAEQRDESLAPSAPHAEGTQRGKRYVDAEGALEIVCNDPGEGSLSVGDEALSIKGAKPLPSSD
jgi:hypothetical protein